MSSTLNQLVEFDCMFHKIGSIIMLIIGCIALAFSISKFGNKSKFTVKSVGTVSNVATTSTTTKDGVQYSVTMGITYIFQGKSVLKAVNSGNNTHTNGEQVNILIDPDSGAIVIASEYMPPSNFAFIGACISAFVILAAVFTFWMTTTLWGCRFLAVKHVVNTVRSF